MKSTTIFGKSLLRCSPCLMVKLILKGALVSIKKLYLKCLCAQHLVYDGINLSGKDVHEIDLPNKLGASCITSYSCCNAELKES